MIKIAIIDDEVNVRQVIKKMLAMLPGEYSIVGEAASIITAKRMLADSQPDIVFLDIELEDGTGFRLLDQLEQINFRLVFITAFNQYAIKAFKYNALDYLLKPIDPQELKATLDRVCTYIDADLHTKELVANLLENKETSSPKIVIKTATQTYFVEIDKILYCKSEGSYTKIVAEDTSILASKNLKHFQDLLPEDVFIRTHQSYLVNKVYITSLTNDSVILKNKESILVSTRRKAAIKSFLTGG